VNWFSRNKQSEPVFEDDWIKEFGYWDRVWICHCGHRLVGKIPNFDVCPTCGCDYNPTKSAIRPVYRFSPSRKEHYDPYNCGLHCGMWKIHVAYEEYSGCSEGVGL